MKRHHSRKMHKKRSAKSHRRHRGGSNSVSVVNARQMYNTIGPQAQRVGLAAIGGKAGRRHGRGGSHPSGIGDRVLDDVPPGAATTRDFAANLSTRAAANDWFLKTDSRPDQRHELNNTGGGKAHRRHKKGGFLGCNSETSTRLCSLLGGSPRSMRRMPSYKAPVRAVEDMGQGMEQGALAAGKGFAETAGDAVEGVVRATQATYIRNRDKLRRDSRSIVDRVKGFGNALTRRLSGLVGGRRTHKKHRK